MADPVRNIIIKLGSKMHSPEVAFKHIQTLLQFAMKKKLKLDPLLRDEIIVTVLSITQSSMPTGPTMTPVNSCCWPPRQMMTSLRHLFQSPQMAIALGVPSLFFSKSPSNEARHRLEFLRNRSNTSDSPIEISPDKSEDPVSNAAPSTVPVDSENVPALISVKSSVSVDPSSIPLGESDCVKSGVSNVSDEKEKPSDEPNNLSLVVFSADNIGLSPAVIADDPKEICPADLSSAVPADDFSVFPAHVETANLSSPHKSKKKGGIPVYTSTSLGENLEAGLPSASIPQPYRVIHPSESSSEDEKILAEVYGTQAPTSQVPTIEATAHPDSTTFRIREVTNLLGGSSAHVSDSSHSVSHVHSPSKETRKSKRKNVPVKVVVESGEDTADVGQPEKKRKSSEPANPETNPLVQQVFKTLRSSVKQKMGLLKTVTAICPYSKLLTYEFYCNLNDDMDNVSGVRPMQIFIRGKWYVFGPDKINEYYGLQGVQEEAITDWDAVAKTITGGQADGLPTSDKDTLPSSQLTSKYVILHRLALHN
ncbi:PREDICTED: uncharacterized protein LOC109152534 [Ipomoea nil]|uniref:uncharacterized protein LOC109152534 n=1 Tax=Ipomoea nil TaxID=35883 RepID=UPI0009017591|nr:PREDICTED: uncharacterized protein LOC109152534 [Ipomoea nil]